jgi:acetoin utilization deacetylase AcuC-like enzyme
MTDLRPLVVRDPRFRGHAPRTPHPERPERLDAVDHALEAFGERVRPLAPREASDDEILAVHGRRYVEALGHCIGQSRQLDPDTYCAPRSVEVARLAAGAFSEAALAIARGEARRAFAALRPPGHHAEQNAPMGFCLLNNVAIAARALRAQAGVERIAIVDWDVHHGNGTQHTFEAERDVLFASLHPFPFYPGPGALDERGFGAGLGATLNLPLPAGCGDAEYGHVFDAVLVPVLRAFRPEMILVSAGFDAHERDPLGGMALSSAAFARFAQRLCAVADELAGGRIALVLEGGYDLDALHDSVAACVEVLAREEPGFDAFPEPTPAARELARVAREVHAQSWPALAPRIQL